jgi:predicted RNA-binding protein
VCQSNVYALEGGREELLLEDVSLIETQNGSVRMCTLFGEPMVVEGRIVGIDLVRQRVYLERTATAD